MSAANTTPGASGLVALMLVGLAACAVGLLAGVALARRRPRPGSGHDRSSVDALGRALVGFGVGLEGRDVERAVHLVRACLAVEGVALVGRDGVSTVDAADGRADRALRVAVSGGAERAPLRHDGFHVVESQILVEGRLVAHLVVLNSLADRGLGRTVATLARLIGAQLASAELTNARQRQTEAQLLALKTQIRPHFVYNALNVISSFTITDPERARLLLAEFADFTRYSFRNRGPFTSLADELRAIDSYLLLERARFGDRLTIRLEISPQSLTTRIPHLCLQPLVENAVRHGIESGEGRGTITITSRDEGAMTIVTVEDNGAGMDPSRLRDVLAGELEGVHVGLRNVDLRLRQIYGPGMGLIIDTALGAGTLITVRVPKSTKSTHPRRS
ncbi:sensor histidine kinase [Streptomyces sp. NL15-2K]|uniref:sensor histidine kinase n=1 Tax=Streptomyces sp. NL15-2K TaxID=376149 RepID=UPI000FFA2263|nr:MULTISPECIES: sensor histidine kinase [Actinomycetes]WKX06293.1 histidine kinase [Kutzneria buriramensis]GCB52844.1 hypothetical protein SNL152K_10201 [Streptomyces sp. NL15-2K]